MASNLKYSTTLKNAQQAAITTVVGASALLALMGGPQPASPDTPVVNTTLNGAITAAATSLTVASAAGLPASGNYTLWVEAEQMTVTGGQGTTTLTVTRGVNGTTAVAHASGAAVTPNPVLATLTCANPFGPAPSNGVLSAGTISQGTGTTAAGPGSAANWYRLSTSGNTPHVDGTVGTSGADLNLVGTTNIAAGQAVTASSYTLTNAN